MGETTEDKETVRPDLGNGSDATSPHHHKAASASGGQPQEKETEDNGVGEIEGNGFDGHVQNLKLSTPKPLDKNGFNDMEVF